MPAITAAVSTTRATSSEPLIVQVTAALTSHTQLRLLVTVWPVSLICFPLKARDELLNPENDTIGILVSTAVEITVGGKTIKPAGGLMLSNRR